jgi:hypothetical protein
MLLDLAEGRGEKLAYLVALDFLVDVNRAAAAGAITPETASRLHQRFLRDGGQETHVRTILLVGGAHIPPESRLTLNESSSRFYTGPGQSS